MSLAVSAADANRNFSKILRDVGAGRSYIITSHGRPVARIVPVGPADHVASAARTALFDRLRDQTAVNVGRWTRDELYEN